MMQFPNSLILLLPLHASINLKLVTFYISVIVLLCSCCEGLIRLPTNVTIPAVFAFGDSTVDHGNNNLIGTLIKCNFPPYGNAFQGGKPTGRFTNGLTPLDLFAQELGVKDIVPAYNDSNLNDQDLLTGVSFASGGSGYDPQTSALLSVISMTDQLEHFKEYIGRVKRAVGEESTTHILRNSVFMVVAGSDDLANTYFTIGTPRFQYDISSYADLLVASASSFVKELYKLGARRISVFGIPPIGCLPSQRTLAGGLLRLCAEDHNQAALLVNAKLMHELDSLDEIRLPQSRVFYADAYNPLLDLIQHYQKYGFEVNDIGCCGTGKIEVCILCNNYSATCADHSKYIFWDSYHPTEKAYKALVNHILPIYINSLG
ncbi:hypothetical protein CASFOL_016947 [Castilleja foliolosa]|uniref:GDSL esterase/lipase EXL3 n=1 Tax=Castilleja foliolosa TaxID=1961234 RepID=A0ABD3DDU6_9LAMI